MASLFDLTDQLRAVRAGLEHHVSREPRREADIFTPRDQLAAIAVDLTRLIHDLDAVPAAGNDTDADAAPPGFSRFVGIDQGATR